MTVLLRSGVVQMLLQSLWLGAEQSWTGNGERRQRWVHHLNNAIYSLSIPRSAPLRSHFSSPYYSAPLRSVFLSHFFLTLSLCLPPILSPYYSVPFRSVFLLNFIQILSLFISLPPSRSISLPFRLSPTLSLCLPPFLYHFYILTILFRSVPFSRPPYIGRHCHFNSVPPSKKTRLSLKIFIKICQD